MSYFPAFVKLDDIEVLIVGGGRIASEKLEHLLDFTNKIKVIAPQLSDDMQIMIEKNSLVYENRVYKKNDIKDFGVVIVAVDDISLQEEIFNESKQYNCLCNSVDSVKYCDFIFPSYVKKGDLTIAVSTSGASPAVAKYLRRYLQKLIPDSIIDFLEEMKSFRKTMPKGRDRMLFLDEKAEKYISRWK